jgi:hypothetical protein
MGDDTPQTPTGPQAHTSPADANELRLGPAHSSDVRQLVYSHSTCLRERVHGDLDLWWEL